jgi:hypothetical protein
VNGTRRILVAVVASVALLGGSIWYTTASANRRAAVPTAKTVTVAPANRILVRSTAPESYGHLATVEIADPDGPRLVSGVSCDRAYAAAGTAICLRPDGPLSTYQLAVLDSGLHERAHYPLVGIPSRARVSPSGRQLTWTVFVTGDSYNGGRFSTRVGMLDTVSKRTVDTLETFAVIRDGRHYQAPDLNFWGVTFTDDGHFFATMSTAGHRYLVAGDVTTQTVRTLAENVECPSLSPDGSRLAFKQAIDDDPTKGWRLSVLDLTTLERTLLAETQNIDDQAAWLGNRTVMYAVRRDNEHADVWRVPADGSGAPTLLVPDAESPTSLADASAADRLLATVDRHRHEADRDRHDPAD